MERLQYNGARPRDTVVIELNSWNDVRIDAALYATDAVMAPRSCVLPRQPSFVTILFGCQHMFERTAFGLRHRAIDRHSSILYKDADMPCHVLLPSRSVAE